MLPGFFTPCRPRLLHLKVSAGDLPTLTLGFQDTANRIHIFVLITDLPRGELLLGGSRIA